MSRDTKAADTADDTASQTRTRIAEAHARLRSRLAAAHGKPARESQLEWTGHRLRAQRAAMRRVTDASSKIARG